MKSIKELELEIIEQDALVRENKAKSLLITIGNMIAQRHGWIERRKDEIAELTNLDNKMRKAYLDSQDDVLEAVKAEINDFDKGRTRRNYGRE